MSGLDSARQDWDGGFIPNARVGCLRGATARPSREQIMWRWIENMRAKITLRDRQIKALRTRVRNLQRELDDARADSVGASEGAS